MYATKKQGLKYLNFGRVAWAWRVCWRVACGRVGVACGRGKKLKKLKQTQKKCTPPIKKIVTLPGRDAT